MNTQRKEIAKFACGFETFHALVHAYFWLSGTVITVFGIEFTTGWNIAGLLVNGLLAVGFGTYAWRAPLRA